MNSQWHCAFHPFHTFDKLNVTIENSLSNAAHRQSDCLVERKLAVVAINPVIHAMPTSSVFLAHMPCILPCSLLLPLLPLYSLLLLLCISQSVIQSVMLLKLMLGKMITWAGYARLSKAHCRAQPGGGSLIIRGGGI